MADFCENCRGPSAEVEAHVQALIDPEGWTDGAWGLGMDQGQGGPRTPSVCRELPDDLALR